MALSNLAQVYYFAPPWLAKNPRSANWTPEVVGVGRCGEERGGRHFSTFFYFYFIFILLFLSLRCFDLIQCEACQVVTLALF